MSIVAEDNYLTLSCLILESALELSFLMNILKQLEHGQELSASFPLHARKYRYLTMIHFTVRRALPWAPNKPFYKLANQDTRI